MASSRREFVARAAAVGGMLSLPSGIWRPTPRPASKPLRVLFLGGTGFIGPHMVRHAMYRGHQITLFNRGKTAPGMFPGVETLVGDRDGKLDALKGREWDVVVDNSGYVPRHVRDTAKLLSGKIGRYVFISTGSVYQFDQPFLDEDSKLLEVRDPASEDVNKYYGELKVLCEQAVNQIYGAKSSVLRLHVVAGPGDPTDRYTYWPVRIAAGGEVVAPGDPTHPVQFIDVRDLAEFVGRVIENDTPGTFNVAGPSFTPVSMAEFLYGVRGAFGNSVQFTWVDEAFLNERKVRYQMWISQNTPLRGITNVRSQRAIAAGLTFRPLAVTARDTYEWFRSESPERQAKVALNLDRDAKLLAEWKARPR
ncbi:MAG: SDR family oxidoreductase [Gemmatimonadales bacterium]|nr:SDR family oxidoreductase [Gemmatimonadales bacterium]